LEISIPVFLLKSSTQKLTIFTSKSSPPRCVLPFVAFTSKMPCSMTNKLTSKVPPPKSKIKIFFSPDVYLSSPYAIAAAVGSLIILRT